MPNLREFALKGAPVAQADLAKLSLNKGATPSATLAARRRASGSNGDLLPGGCAGRRPAGATQRERAGGGELGTVTTAFPTQAYTLLNATGPWWLRANGRRSRPRRPAGWNFSAFRKAA